MLFATNSTATTIVRRVRFRSTMWVPPWEAGVKPIPPIPASRPLCMSTSDTSANTRSTWTTARKLVTPERVAAASCYGHSVDEDEARERIQHLLVTGDNRLKQGVDPEKVRETWEEALAVARQAGLEDTVRPLVEVRLADLRPRG